MFGMLYVVLQGWGSFQNDAIWIYGTTFFGFVCHLYGLPLYALMSRFTETSKLP